MPVEVRAPLNGSILDIMVEPGAAVEVDDELLVIEAMKMQNLIYSPATGTVKDVLVKKGDKVDEDTVLMTIEEA